MMVRRDFDRLHAATRVRSLRRTEPIPPDEAKVHAERIDRGGGGDVGGKVTAKLNHGMPVEPSPVASPATSSEKFEPEQQSSADDHSRDQIAGPVHNAHAQGNAGSTDGADGGARADDGADGANEGEIRLGEELDHKPGDTCIRCAIIEWLPRRLRKAIELETGRKGDPSSHCQIVIRALLEHALADEAIRLVAEGAPFARQVGDLDAAIIRERKKWTDAGGKYAQGSTAELLHYLLRTHAVVLVGGNAYISGWRRSELPGNCEVLDLIRPTAFHQFYCNRYWLIINDKGEPKLTTVSKKFLLIARRYNALVYAPGKDQEVSGCLNLWRGFGVEPKPGSWKLMQEHILDVLAAGDKAVAEYILRWAAWAVQHPGQQAEVALVFKGGRGVGKGVFGRSMARLFGSHGLQISSPKHLIGAFNMHLAHCSLLFADEPFGAGVKRGEGTLKRLITEPTLVIEPKGIDLFTVHNCLHVIMASNESWVVPAGHDERRYAVMNVSDKHQRDKPYFNALYAEIDNGGLQAMLHDLLATNLDGWHPRNDVPQTRALQEQKIESLQGIDKVIVDLAHDGCIQCHVAGRPDVASTTGEHLGIGFWFFCKSVAPELRHSYSRTLMLQLRQWGCTPFKSGMVRGIQFPPLRDLRAAFENKYGPHDWDDAEDWQGPEA